MKEKTDEFVVEQEDRVARSKKTIRNYMWFSMGAGLIPFPFIDLAAICALQLKMISDLCKHYETPFKENSGKAIISALLGYVVPSGITGSLLKTLPFIGPIAGGISMAVFTGGTTYAIGAIFIRHFEAGGTLLNFDPKKMREFFMEEFEHGKEIAADMRKGKTAAK